MAAALAVTPSSVHAGQPITVTGTGWGSDPVDVLFQHEQENSTIKVTLTPSTGDITTVGVFTFAPGWDGIWTITADDGTSKVTKKVTVFMGGA